MRQFCTLRPGRTDYHSGLVLQEQLLQERRQGYLDYLLLLEHTPVVTLGRSSDEANLLASREDLARQGIDFVKAGRGGDVTYHGPGQIVGYPIVDLAPFDHNLHLFLRRLEEVLLATLRAFGLEGERIEGKTGVWVRGAKIASIGIGVRHWISWHGFSLNVTDQTSGFSHIVPCGLHNIAITSMEEQLGRQLPIATVEEQIIQCFGLVFDSTYTGDYENSAQK